MVHVLAIRIRIREFSSSPCIFISHLSDCRISHSMEQHLGDLGRAEADAFAPRARGEGVIVFTAGR